MFQPNEEFGAGAEHVIHEGPVRSMSVTQPHACMAVVKWSCVRPCSVNWDLFSAIQKLTRSQTSILSARVIVLHASVLDALFRSHTMCRRCFGGCAGCVWDPCHAPHPFWGGGDAAWHHYGWSPNLPHHHHRCGITCTVPTRPPYLFLQIVCGLWSTFSFRLAFVDMQFLWEQGMCECRTLWNYGQQMEHGFGSHLVSVCRSRGPCCHAPPECGPCCCCIWSDQRSAGERHSYASAPLSDTSPGIINTQEQQQRMCSEAMQAGWPGCYNNHTYCFGIPKTSYLFVTRRHW